MKTLSVVLVGLYAVLNLFLAVTGLFLLRDSSSLLARGVPCALFLTAGLLLGVGAVRGATWMVVVGLVLGSVAPFLYGVWVEHSNVLLHHAVRAVVAVGIGVIWFSAHSTR